MSSFNNATGGKRTRKNYETIIHPIKGGPAHMLAYVGGTFHYKDDAIALACSAVDMGRRAKVKNVRTGQVTHMLARERCSCTVCGNELQGKKHCPLCGALHYYR